MKLLLFVFLLNIILIVEAEYNIFSIEASGCENGTLILNQCGKYCEKYASISGNYYNFELSFFTDSSCTNLGNYENTNTPFIIDFDCYGDYNELGTNGLIHCSNLEPEYYTFQIPDLSCKDRDKIIPLGKCTKLCNSSIVINYDPFEYYSITTYSTNDCSDGNGFSSLVDCYNSKIVYNNQSISCFETFETYADLSSTSSSIYINYNFIIISILSILFIYIDN